MTVRKPPTQKYTKNQLLDFVIEAIQDSGYRMLFVSSSNVHPFKLRIYNETENFLVKVYIWNLSHGGGVKRPKNEYRIQISGVDVFREEPGYSTLILGYWTEVEVFADFDLRKHLGVPGKSASMQIKEEHLRNAHLNGISACDKCAFCSIQLKLVDAAHILPVSHDHSTDETCNGIALCALHHRAYDNALVTFNPVFQILFSEDKMEKLKKIGQDSGMEKFIQDLRPLINLPPAKNDRPNINYIVKANEIRGWNVK